MMTVAFEDDLDGGPAGETLWFAIDSTTTRSTCAQPTLSPSADSSPHTSNTPAGRAQCSGSGQGGPPPARHAARTSGAWAKDQRIIMPTVPFFEVGAWRARLGELEGQVCRVEIPAELKATVGTGFLVASDLCLTNHHVVQPLISQDVEPASARLRFDLRRADDGTEVSLGTCFSLADDWLVAYRPPARRTPIPPSDYQPMTNWISRCCALRASTATLRLAGPTKSRTPRPAGGSGRSGQRPRPAIPYPSCSTPTARR
jgi:hypothetical protein